MNIKTVYGPPTILELQEDMEYGNTFMACVVLRGETDS